MEETEGRNDLDSWVDSILEDEDSDSEGTDDEAGLQSAPTVSEEERLEREEVDGFKRKLEDAKALLKSTGQMVGLCEYCLGTDKIIANRMSGYSGIEYRVDNEIIVPIKCHHGEDITEGFGF